MVESGGNINKEWRSLEDKTSERAWQLLIDASRSAVKKLCSQKHLYFVDLDDKILDCATTMMDRVHRGFIPTHLKTYARLVALSVLFGVKAKKRDLEIIGDPYKEKREDEHNITYDINGKTYCTLETEDECNNILVYSKTPHMTTFKDVMIFLDILYTVHHIDYVSVYLENPIWEKVLDKFILVKESDRQYYGRLSENIETIRKYSRRK